MLQRDGTADEWGHGNIVVAGHDSLLRLFDAARALNSTEGSCDEGADGGDVGRALRRLAFSVSTASSQEQQGIVEDYPNGAHVDNTGRRVSGLPRREIALERAGCVVVLKPGDALFFGGDVYHRTQDTAAGRVSLQVTFDSPTLVS